MEQEEFKIEYIASNNIEEKGVKEKIKEFIGELYLEPTEDGENKIIGGGADLTININWYNLPSENIFIIIGIGETPERLNEFKKTFEAIGDLYFNSFSLIYSSVGEKRCKNGYVQLHILENELRIFIIKTLMFKLGHDWWDTAVPNKVRSKGRYNPRSLKEKELKLKYCDSEKTFSLIHYTDFGDIKKIIEEVTNWNVFFNSIFQDQRIIYKLEELEPIRHKIAHNRYLTDENEKALDYYYTQLLRLAHQK